MVWALSVRPADNLHGLLFLKSLALPPRHAWPHDCKHHSSRFCRRGRRNGVASVFSVFFVFFRFLPFFLFPLSFLFCCFCRVLISSVFPFSSFFFRLLPFNFQKHKKNREIPFARPPPFCETAEFSAALNRDCPSKLGSLGCDTTS